MLGFGDNGARSREATNAAVAGQLPFKTKSGDMFQTSFRSALHMVSACVMCFAVVSTSETTTNPDLCLNWGGGGGAEAKATENPTATSRLSIFLPPQGPPNMISSKTHDLGFNTVTWDFVGTTLTTFLPREIFLVRMMLSSTRVCAASPRITTSLYSMLVGPMAFL